MSKNPPPVSIRRPLHPDVHKAMLAVGYPVAATAQSKGISWEGFTDDEYQFVNSDRKSVEHDKPFINTLIDHGIMVREGQKVHVRFNEFNDAFRTAHGIH